MRLGEIFGLQWPDVDLKGRSINVGSTLIEINGKLSLAEPKIPKSRRRVDLPQFVVDALTKHRAQSVREGFAKVPCVFCNSTGGPLRRIHFHANHFKPLLGKAGLPDIRFHDLRHTHVFELGARPRFRDCLRRAPMSGVLATDRLHSKLGSVVPWMLGHTGYVGRCRLQTPSMGWCSGSTGQPRAARAPRG
jgi:integrase